MDELKQAAIEHRYADLMKSMDPLLVMDNLHAGLVSLEQRESIEESHITRRNRNRKLISILYKKNEKLKPFERFVKALKKTDANHEIMANDILKTYKHDNGTAFPKVPSTSLSAARKAKHLQIVQKSLRQSYLTRFEKVNPFSLPFTFDIENTWVSLALKEEQKNLPATEDHVELLNTAFKKEKMLIIEGDPATGKTSLMRRLAYEWAKQEDTEAENRIPAATSILGKRRAIGTREGHMEQIDTTDKWANGKQELLHYDLVLYAEFREVREKTFASFVDLVLGGLKKYLTKGGYKNLKKLVNNEQFCRKCRILVLLDGYDESSREDQCKELSAYIAASVVQSSLKFHVVLTSRQGYLSKYRGNKGRFVFAEVLGFTTKLQKEKYVCSHFLSQEINNEESIAAVHHLLDNNDNLKSLAETPLFLTFICLVHERIIDGTLLELYCNIIWWLIDRHQQDFPDRDIPALFRFQNGSNDKFETIQDHYLHFPQLYCLGKVALHNLEESVFKPTDCAQFNLQPIIEQVGLLIKERKHDNSFRLTTLFHFPHRTIQEFLAAFYCLCSNYPTNAWLLRNCTLNTSTMNEFERFLLRIALSDRMPIHAEKRKYYFERITNIELDITFDVFNSTAGFNNDLLNWFISQCTNVKNIMLRGNENKTRHAFNSLKNTSIPKGAIYASVTSSSILLSFNHLMKLHSLTFLECIFNFSDQLSFTNCPSLKNVKFKKCEITSSTDLGITALPAIDTVEFKSCICEANSQLSFKNCPSLKNLKFNQCQIESSTNLGIATLPEIGNLEFYNCEIDLATWQSITYQIQKSSIECLKLNFGVSFSKEFLVFLQKCKNVEKMEIVIMNYKIYHNDRLSFSDLTKLQSLVFGYDNSKCTFEASSQLSYKNCSSLKNLQFHGCEITSSTNLGIATLPALATVEFNECKIDLATWQSITNQIRNSSVRCLKLKFKLHFNKGFLIHLQNCCNVESMEITILEYKIRQIDLISFSDLMKLHSLAFWDCTFEANLQLSFTNCPSLKNLRLWKCDTESNTNLAIGKLPSLDILEINECKIDLATWQAILEAINNGYAKCLKLNFGREFDEEFLIHLQRYNFAISEVSYLDYKIYEITKKEQLYQIL